MDYPNMVLPKTVLILLHIRENIHWSNNNNRPVLANWYSGQALASCVGQEEAHIEKHRGRYSHRHI